MFVGEATFPALRHRFLVPTVFETKFVSPEDNDVDLVAADVPAPYHLRMYRELDITVPAVLSVVE